MTKVTIGKKINLACVAFIVITAATGGIALFLMNRIAATDQIHKKFSRLEIIAKDLNATEKRFVTDDLLMASFWQTGESEQLKEFKSLTEQFDRILTTIEQNPLSEELNLPALVRDLRHEFNTYQNDFKAIVGSYQKLGNPQYGLKGAAQSAFDKLTKLKEARQFPDLFLARQWEQQVFADQTKDSMDHSKQSLFAAIKEIEASNLSAAQKAELIDATNQYRRAIDEAYAQITLIGLGHTSGLRSHIDRSSKTLVPKLEKAENMMDAIAHSTMTEAKVWIGSLLLVTIVMGFGIAYFLTRTIIHNLMLLKDGAESIAKGNFDTDIKVKTHDELGQVADSFRAMTRTLNERSEAIEVQNWVKSNLSKLMDGVQQHKNPYEIGEYVLNNLIPLIDAQMGVFFGRDMEKDMNSFQLVASYAYTHRKKTDTTIKLGDGLIGQAIKEKKAIVVSDLPDDYMEIGSGLGQKVPRYVLIQPAMIEENVTAVIEIATFRPLHKHQLELVEQFSNYLASVIANIYGKVATERLLAETQAQNEEIQNQAEELEELNSQLEAQTNDLRDSQEETERRNQELKSAEMELTRRAEELQEASKYKSEFLANMSHELRTPLNSILILSKLLTKENNLSKQQVKHADTIYSAGSDLLQLINEVLDLSKIEAGHMRVDVIEFPVQDIIDTQKQLFEEQVKEKGIKLICNLADDVPKMILSDFERIRQVVRNFTSNAIKYTDEGAVTLNITSPSKDMVSIAVTDTGIGIPKEKHHLVFQAFQQIDGSTTRKYAGTGLGLSICTKIAELLGGHITLDSEEGKGSTFTFTIPARISESLIQKGEHLSAPLSKPKKGEIKVSNKPVKFNDKPQDDTSRINMGDKILLVIEDDPTFSEIIMENGHKWGYKVLIADTGSSGIRLAEKYIPTAVILDIQLPVFDGWVVLQSLKSNPETRHIPVLIVSGIDDKHFGMRLGAFDFYTKPISPDGLDIAFDELNRYNSKEIKNVLIIEDNDRERDAIVELIKSDDLQITHTGSGAEALRLLKSSDFDCIVLDLKLPDMPGKQVLEAINHDGRLKRTPVIIYTGAELSDSDEAYLRHLSDSIIVKSVNSPARLLEETSIFLHRIKDRLGEEQIKLMEELSEPEKVFHNKTILVVDDDVRNVYALAAALENKGLTVLTAANGEDALNILQEEVQGIHLILMDMMMPQLDGYETTRRVRQMPNYQYIPIIALTAKAMKGDRQQCIEAGASDYLSKPIDIQQLVSLIRVWLSAKQGPKSLAS